MAQSVPVPIPPSAGLGNDPSTPPPLVSGRRARSDTTWSDASFPDSPILQTPLTPYLVGLPVTNSRIKRGRTASYDFATSPETPSLTTAMAGATNVSPGGQNYHNRFARRRSSTPFFSLGDPAIEETGNTGAPALSQQVQEGEAATQEVAPLGYPHITVPPPTPATSSTPPTLSQPTPGSGSSTPRSIGAAVRRGIVRSKASLRRLRADGDEQIGGSPDEGMLGPTDTDPSTGSQSTKARLRSLISLQRSRARSFSQSSSSSSSSFPGMLSAMSPVTASADTGSLHGTLAAEVATMPVDHLDDSNPVLPGEQKAKTRMRNTRQRLHRRSASLGMHNITHPPFSVVLASAGLHSPTAPLPSDELVWGTLSYRAPAPVKVDHFTTKLPRELKVQVFRSLVDIWAGQPGRGRWEGENGGRRELVKMSRVSKEWRSLCFDGQLWARAVFTPFAAVLHPNTVEAILAHARPCVKELSLRGCEGIAGSALTGLELAQFWAVAYPIPHLAPLFSALTTLDLRGAHGVAETDIIAILQVSPHLKVLNLKGCRVSLSFVLRAVVESVEALEVLDVSRCWSLEFRDLEAFLWKLSDRQRQALRSLRMAGLNNTSGGHLMHCIGSWLPNLHTLDLLGCRWLGIVDIKEYVKALGERPSPLRHLILSNCTNMTTDALELLVGKVPNMTHFEGAGLEAVFYLDPPPTLARLVRSMPLLERLDLDGTGRYGGVCDRLLLELIPGACPGSPLEVSHLVELRIGCAKSLTTAMLLRLVRSLPRLSILEADGTEADNAVMRAFVANHRRAPATLSVVDCHRLTSEAYSELAQKTRPRAGWTGYRAAPMSYGDNELEPRPTLKTFWAWRRVAVPRPWREARAVGEAREQGATKARHMGERRMSGGRGAWWRAEEVDDIERGACVIM